MDGVLLDTEPFYTEATQAIVARFGKVYDWALKANMMGRPAIDAARYLVAALDLPIAPEAYLAEREALLLAMFTRAEAVPGARELTAELHRHRVPMAIATSTHARLYEHKVGRHRAWFALFSAVVCGDHPRVHRGKPAPDIFLVAADAL